MFVGFKAKTKAGFYRFPLSGTTSQLDVTYPHLCMGFVHPITD